jgi:hypothetical protein
VREVLEGVTPSFVCDATGEALGAALVECLREGRRSNGRERSTWLDEGRIAERMLELYGTLMADSRAVAPAGT